ncbi:MAG: Flp pilus assembly protein CpaB [Candidatus Omnitrophica bacterium]|nr:Flp pilus assembly protein CpaB [Candidatus Omnitrophota bacterium]
MMNLENKKQMATLALAIGLGFVAVFLTGEFVKSKINSETQRLANEYKKQQATLAQEMEKRILFVKQEMEKQKQELEQKLKEQQKSVRISKDKTGEGGGEGDRGIVSMAAFSVKTPPGKRALTVMIDSLSAVGGLINPGDFVDIIAHLKIPTDPKSLVEGSEAAAKKKLLPTTTVLFQNMQILAVDANFKVLDETPPNYAALQKARSINVTIAVSPEEATLLTFAQDNGKLQLMLRSPAEQNTVKMGPASWDALADYLMQRQGTEIDVPRDAPPIQTIELIEDEGEEVKPFIEIFKSGKQSK